MANRFAAVLYRLETITTSPVHDDNYSNVERLRLLVESLEKQVGIVPEETSNCQSQGNPTNTQPAAASNDTLPAATTATAGADNATNSITATKSAKEGGCCTIT
eukprot:TRINITY_DN10340_c0_g3_i1.p1 TRINITY_DN10340_c0_g3~~TRINITY_DN10340_c0_g3_i1.p1  ORF type:complete len:116 (+),score=5.88 TRINITY_DN10340_c0_g3_i1:39-350(+)